MVDEPQNKTKQNQSASMENILQQFLPHLNIEKMCMNHIYICVCACVIWTHTYEYSWTFLHIFRIYFREQI